MNDHTIIYEEEESLKINDNFENTFKIYKSQRGVLNTYYYLIKYLLVFSLILAIIIFFSELNKLIIIAENNNIRIWKKGRLYLDNCLKGLLINRIEKFPENNVPLISIVIPIYNDDDLIISSIRSIQNQKFSNFEIILVNDFSEDNDWDLLENIQIEDSRIKIIKNEKKMGILYSRSVGVLSAKGKYIFALDNNDMFFVDDILQKIYEIAEENDYDIVEFKSVISKNFNATLEDMKDGGLYNHPHNLIIHQPELGLFPISRFGSYVRNDLTIWAKCIKTEVYKKAINEMGVKKYTKNVIWAEDASIIFIIFNIAQSFKFVRKYGLFHLETNYDSNKLTVHKKTYGEIFLIDIIFEFLKNNNKNYAVYQALDSAQKEFFNVRYSKRNSNFLKSVIQKILSCQYITEENKKKVRECFDNIKYFNQTEKDEYMKSQFENNINNANNDLL